MKIGIKAGHTLTSGAVGLVKESTEVRTITRAVARMLKTNGFDVAEVIVDTGNASAALLSGIDQLNAAGCDLVLEIHLNAGVGDLYGNGKTTGTEAYVYSDSSSAKKYAKGIVDEIAKLGYKNRGVKVKSDFTFLKRTTAPAVLAECFFCDDRDDVQRYQSEEMAAAIVKGITGAMGQQYVQQEEIFDQNTNEDRLLEGSAVEPEAAFPEGEFYRVQVGAYKNKSNAAAIQAKLLAAGYNAIVICS